MRHAILLLCVLAIVLPIWGSGALATDAADRTIVFHVEGMTCALCGKAIKKTLITVEGVRNVVVDRKAERVTVESAADVKPESLEQAIESSGSYRAEVIQNP